MVNTNHNTFQELVSLFERLRSPDGCPWDREQTHTSLKRYLLEECYEVMEAIDLDSPGKLAEELGDILLQVLFHSQIGQEASQFSIEDVLKGLRDKLIRRHPHVFGGATAKDAREVETNWEQLKKNQEDSRTNSALGKVPIGTPALAYSQLIQDRASRAGFDWDSIDGVLEKLVEEIGEIRQASTNERVAEEFGDLLMVLVNVGRWLGVYSEDALHQASARFTKRFIEMERLAEARSISFVALPLERKEALWEEVKRRGQEPKH